MKKIKKPKAEYVTILGQRVKVGTKQYEKLMWQKKHFDDLQKSEVGYTKSKSKLFTGRKKIHSIGSVSYFNTSNIHNLDELKKEYWKLAKRLHPDTPTGNEEAYKAMQNEYDNLTDHFLKSGNFTTAEAKNEIELDEVYKEIISVLIPYEDIKIELIGTWIWVSGNTYPIREVIKKANFKFAPVKKMWYFHFGDRSKSKGDMNIDQIRSKYGSKDVKPQGRAKLTGVNNNSKLARLFAKLKKYGAKRKKYITKVNKTKLK
jgi:hypothetical protein